MNGCFSTNVATACLDPSSTDLVECIRVGILHNPLGRFLTAESFNNEINVSCTVLRKRQIWSMQIHPSRPGAVYLLNYLDRYLSADNDGRIYTSRTPCTSWFPTSYDLIFSN
ncbi:unnamed protein product [Protopolystoma xenopodis]|uniref:Fascin-like domain-containing protein n=1 Tax=Protopolystoma xenopodis TaxID=117903 RepID=A0A448XHI4_9PLAT|nr:unnamed protein product [Protopolystoma xenopodis]